jgi:hypothetical protein
MATSSSLVRVSSTRFTCNNNVTRDEFECQTRERTSFLQAEALADDALAAGPATPERFLRAPSPASPQPSDLVASAASRPDPGGSSYRERPQEPPFPNVPEESSSPRWKTACGCTATATALSPGFLYLHSRNGGMIGSLLRLVRAAAIQAVLHGTEAITETTLESIPVDIASDGGHVPG